MILKVYKVALSKGMSDNEALFSWFLTCMFRHLGEHDTLTMHRTDIQYILFNTTCVKFTLEKIQEGPLSKAFLFIDLGDRIAIRLRQDVLDKKYNGRRLGVLKTEIVDEYAMKLGIYLHAALNFIDSIVSESDSPFEPVDHESSRFGKGPTTTYSVQDRFSVENMLGDPLNKRNRKNVEREYLFKR